MPDLTDHAVQEFSDFLRLKDLSTMPDKAIVLALRKSMVQKMCRYYGVDRVSELKPDAMEVALAAFGLKPISKSDPAPLTTLATERARRADMHTKRLCAEIEADAVGQLWTGMASLDRGKAFIVVWQGYLEDESVEAFHSQHVNAGMFLDPHTFIGDKQSMRKHFIGMFNTADIHLRTIAKDS